MINKKDYNSAHILPLLTSKLADSLQNQSFGKKNHAKIVIGDDLSGLKSALERVNLAAWRKTDEIFDSSFTADGDYGPVQFCYIKATFQESSSLWPSLTHSSAWGTGRFKLGETIKALESFGMENLEVDVFTENEELFHGVICGLELSSYSFKGRKNTFKKVHIKRNGQAVRFKDVEEASIVGWSANWARHLVNLPPNVLQPENYAQIAKEIFQKKAHVKVDIWNEKKLEQEKCNLLLGVGAGSSSPPRLVILRYRPPSAPKKSKPVALVGKGITFDTGGLDIKPSQAMRLMKKDMGGSAAVFGAFHFAVENKLPIKLDAYLALAENAVSADSFRPSDLITARNGKVIEIHNTDAEGRLAMADALDVATTQKGDNQPEMVIDVATLTGAIKVALGSQIAGLFANDDELAQGIFSSFTKRGDDLWPMPLYQKYKSQMNSSFADMVNSVDGFGGAVTAALFLENFVNEVPWAHLDIYAWKDSAEGALLENGGSGQAVQGLCLWLKSRVQTKS